MIKIRWRMCFCGGKITNLIMSMKCRGISGISGAVAGGGFHQTRSLLSDTTYL
jgi:hypothetical protein